MAAGNDQTEKRRLQIRMGQKIGGHMPLYMMDADERLAQAKSQGLGVGHPHQKGPHQTGAVGDGDGIHRL